MKKEAEKAMRKVEVTVSFDDRSVIIGKESYTEWNEGWKNWKRSWLKDKNEKATKFGREETLKWNNQAI